MQGLRSGSRVQRPLAVRAHARALAARAHARTSPFREMLYLLFLEQPQESASQQIPVIRKAGVSRPYYVAALAFRLDGSC